MNDLRNQLADHCFTSKPDKLRFQTGRLFENLKRRIEAARKDQLKTMKLWIGSKGMTAELALTPLQQETGMMFRTNMGPDEGMLFVFDQPQRASFWMMNTILPLSAAYISPEGEILEIHALTPHDTNAVVAASPNVQYVLETPQGWFESNHIPVGTVIAAEQGPLKRVFFGAR